MDYNKRYNRLVERKKGVSSHDFSMESFTKSFSSYKLKNNKILRYVLESLEPVDDEYTKNTILEGERVKKHLADELEDVEFRYQGSVTNNTHIKRYSDVDLLTICNKFYTHKKVMPELDGYTSNPYSGDPITDLQELRSDSITILNKRFPSVDIDTSGAKSIALSGGSLKRKIDVVPSNYYHTEEYKRTKKDYMMGIQVLDAKKLKRIVNTPFYHNELLNNKDKLSNCNYKRIVRLLKTLKMDSDKEIKISSYDITAIIYHMPNDRLAMYSQTVPLLENVYMYLSSISNNKTYFRNLNVPDGSRKIIRNENDFDDIEILCNDLKEIIIDLKKELITNEIKLDNLIYA